MTSWKIYKLFQEMLYVLIVERDGEHLPASTEAINVDRSITDNKATKVEGES
jgi:hypothetical protein